MPCQGTPMKKATRQNWMKIKKEKEKGKSPNGENRVNCGDHFVLSLW